MNLQEVLILLGSPNSPDGKLGPIALDRVKYVNELFQQEKRPILCTGGFGSHLIQVLGPMLFYYSRN